MKQLGTYNWKGYSFAWFACILARVGQPEAALQYLTDYERAFTLRNGFHANGDQIGAGLSRWTFRPITIEGNFLAMEAVQEMLLQSWPVDLRKDPTPVIRIFPATPRQWYNASFRDLHAEGGFIVSAERKNNVTTHFKIKATCDGELRLRDNFGDTQPIFNREVKKVGDNFIVDLKKGQTLTGEYPKAEFAKECSLCKLVHEYKKNHELCLEGNLRCIE